MDTCRLCDSLSAVGCIHRQLILQNTIYVGMQDMGVDMFGNNLAETMCKR